MTDDMIVGGETDSYLAPPAEYVYDQELHMIPKHHHLYTYDYGTTAEEFAEWCNAYIYGPQG